MKPLCIRRALPLCFLAVLSLKAQSTNEFPELIPPYAELPPTFWEQYGGLMSISILACVALISAVVWMIRHPKPSPPLPPEVQARQALEALRTQPEDGALLSQVSQILKRYFVATFGKEHSELTTEEVERIVSLDKGLKVEACIALINFLKCCDQLKFGVSADVNGFRAVGQAIDLLQQLEACRSPSQTLEQSKS